MTPPMVIVGTGGLVLVGLLVLALIITLIVVLIVRATKRP